MKTSLVLALAAAASVAACAATPVPSFPVEQTRNDLGERMCRLFVASQDDPAARLALLRYENGVENLFITVPDIAKAAGADGYVHARFTLDGSRYEVAMVPSVSQGGGVVILFGTWGHPELRDMFQRIPESRSVAVKIGGESYDFTLTDLAAKFDQLGHCGDRLVAEAAARAQAEAAQRQAEALVARREIPLRRDGREVILDVTLDGLPPLAFMLDSGASDVVLPQEVVTRLMEAGTLSEDDRLRDVIVALADGSEHLVRRYRLHSLTVGGVTVRDVVCMTGGSLLLGQSFLRKFKSWSVDNARDVLILDWSA